MNTDDSLNLEQMDKNNSQPNPSYGHNVTPIDKESLMKSKSLACPTVEKRSSKKRTIDKKGHSNEEISSPLMHK